MPHNRPQKLSLEPLTDSMQKIFACDRQLLKASSGAVLIGCMGFQHEAQALDVTDLDGSNGFILTEDVAGSFIKFGYSVQSVGDVNGDGLDDFVTKNIREQTRIVFGSTDPFPSKLNTKNLDGTNGFTVAGDFSGSSDINGDSIPDLIFNGVFTGLEGGFVVFGRDVASKGNYPATITHTDLDGNNGFRITDAANEPRYTLNTMVMGDISGDGIDDILLLEYSEYDNSGRREKTSLYVVFGRNDTDINPFPADFSLSQMDGSDGFRVQNAFIDADGGFYAISNSISDMIVDFDGDDINDIVSKESYFLENRGGFESIQIHHLSRLGNNGQFPAVIDNLNYVTDVLDNNGLNLYEGRVEVDLAGDINNDGADDIAVKWFYEEFGVYYDPRRELTSRIVFGADKGVRLFESTGSVNPLGDVNGDNIDDLIFHLDEEAPGNISDHILFGKDVNSQGDFPSTIDLSYFDGANGFSLVDSNLDNEYVKVTTGDLNGDEIRDIVLSSPRRYSSSSGSDVVQILFGSKTPVSPTLNLNSLNPSQGQQIKPSSPSDDLGDSMDIADLNGDQIGDLILGAPGYKNNKGAVYVVFGSPANTTSPMLVCPGDVDGDGGQDFAVLNHNAVSGKLNAKIKNINGKQISSVNFNRNFDPVSIKVITDLNNNQSPELVVVDKNSAKAEVRDSLTGKLLNSFDFHANGGTVAFEPLADQNGNGTTELASLNQFGRVNVKDAQTSRIINKLSFSLPDYTPVDISVFDSLPPKIGVLAENKDSQEQDKLFIKDLSTGRSIKNIRYGKGWQVSRLTLLSDINGNGSQEAAVLRDDNGKVSVMIRDGQTGKLVNVLGFDPNFPSVEMALSSDLNNNGSEEIIVLGQKPSSGSIKTSVKDAKSGKLIKNLFFNKHLIAHDLAVCPDINGNNQPEIVVLGERERNGELVLVVKDAKTGRLVGTVNF